VDALAWWIANSVVAALIAFVIWVLIVAFDMSFDAATVAISTACGWLIGRSGARL
jgi:hypothetical protein